MEALSEFPLEFENNERIIKTKSVAGIKLYVGIMENDVIISSLSRNTDEIRITLNQNCRFIK